jgi:7-cyano-7-deazaguanine synthase
MKKAVLLLSGGIDSATCGAIARKEGHTLYALSFSYGQRHAVELEYAKKVALFLGAVDHRTIALDPAAFGGSSLTTLGDVPKNRDLARNPDAIPSTYVPARNTIFLSYALGWAEALGARDIFIGVNALDYSGYPDCRPEFIGAFQRMANLATRAGIEGKFIEIHTPLIKLKKAEIIRQGAALGLDYGLTHSCYDPSPDGAACGACDSCLIRKKGFDEAGIKDPTRYQ